MRCPLCTNQGIAVLLVLSHLALPVHALPLPPPATSSSRVGTATPPSVNHSLYSRDLDLDGSTVRVPPNLPVGKPPRVRAEREGGKARKRQKRNANRSRDSSMLETVPSATPTDLSRPMSPEFTTPPDSLASPEVALAPLKIPPSSRRMASDTKETPSKSSTTPSNSPIDLRSGLRSDPFQHYSTAPGSPFAPSFPEPVSPHPDLDAMKPPTTPTTPTTPKTPSAYKTAFHTPASFSPPTSPLHPTHEIEPASPLPPHLAHENQPEIPPSPARQPPPPPPSDPAPKKPPAPKSSAENWLGLGVRRKPAAGAYAAVMTALGGAVGIAYQVNTVVHKQQEAKAKGASHLR
ncbi:hypothetical protein ACQY0O_005559 [Thecaphora frezii]